MSKLTVCKTCGKPIADDAKICPHCGAKHKKKTPFFAWIVGFFLICFLLGQIANYNTNNSDSLKQNSDESSGDTVEVVFDAQQFMIIDSTTGNYLTVSEKDLIDLIGEPESIDEWDYESGGMRYPIRTLSYDGGNYAYEFNNDYLVRIQIFKPIPYRDKSEILEMFNLKNLAKTKVVDTGVAYRIYNCMVNDLWCTLDSDKNLIETTYISYSNLFE